MGYLSGQRKRGSEANALKSRKGIGYDVRKAKRRPCNVAIRGLLGNEILTEAVLRFLGVGTIKAGRPMTRYKVAGPVFLSFLSLF